MTTTPNPVLVWQDGTVSVGTDRLRAHLEAGAYGYADEEPTGVFVNDSGALVEVTIEWDNLRYDADDYAYPEVRLVKRFAPGSEPLLTLRMRLDGRG